MKKCPFCAEEIQDAAIVCKHCGRDLNGPVVTAIPVGAAKPKTGTFTKVLAWAVVLMAIAVVASLVTKQSTPTASSRGVSTEPEEPCRVEAAASVRSAAENWCQGGVFTKVNVNNDANNFIVMLQFSKKGQRVWANDKGTVLNRFRGITNEMVEKADMSVAFSLHGTDGRLVGGCARNRNAREATCN